MARQMGLGAQTSTPYKLDDILNPEGVDKGVSLESSSVRVDPRHISHKGIVLATLIWVVHLAIRREH